MRFKIARKRLLEEQDIRHLIQMNRITRLIHKDTFSSRQRRTVDYAHRYVITQSDVRNAKIMNEDHERHAAPKIANVEECMKGYDPHNCRTDRRLLYEVTGRRISAKDFIDSGTSSDEIDEDMPDLPCFNYTEEPAFA